MSDIQVDPSWWMASNAKWYPPQLHPEYVPPAVTEQPTPAEQPQATEMAQRPAQVGSPAQPTVPVPDQSTNGPRVIGTPGAGPLKLIENQTKGLEGERATAAALDQLPSTYCVAHGLEMRSGKGRANGDVDHLVIGPTGVWVIDSKAEAGGLKGGKGTLWNGRYPITDKVEKVVKQAEYAAVVLQVPTNPMLCFTQASLPRPHQVVGTVQVVSLDVLVSHIQLGEAVLSAAVVDRLFKRVLAWSAEAPAVDLAADGLLASAVSGEVKAADAAQPARTGARGESNASAGKKSIGGMVVVLLLAAVVLVILGILIWNVLLRAAG